MPPFRVKALVTDWSLWPKRAIETNDEVKPNLRRHAAVLGPFFFANIKSAAKMLRGSVSRKISMCLVIGSLRYDARLFRTHGNMEEYRQKTASTDSRHLFAKDQSRE